MANPSNASSLHSTPNNTLMPISRFHLFKPRAAALFDGQDEDSNGRKSFSSRKTVDYNSSIVKMLESRLWGRHSSRCAVVEPGHVNLPPMYLVNNPSSSVTSKLVQTCFNRERSPVNCVQWTPDGRRVITASASGEFTLWNGLTFNFETIIQAHESPVQAIAWSHNDSWMVSADRSGFVKYWQSNMNSVKMFQAHPESIRDIAFAPMDTKFATCSIDGTVRIWDFLTCKQERMLVGHGGDVNGVDWHPVKALIASASKNTQQPVKLWDAKSGKTLATLYAHKHAVMDVKWNQNGNWLLTCSRDRLIKIFDIRNMSSEMQTFRGHSKEVKCLAWHPMHEGLFASGATNGDILFWLVDAQNKIGAIEDAHKTLVNSLSWHPLGHVLASGSLDNACKIWTRN